MLDSGLYPLDYFVPPSNSILTVRYFFERIMVMAGSLKVIELLCFILTLLCVTLLVRSIIGITESFFPDSEAKWIAPVMVLFIFYGFTVGGNHITYPSLISSTIAKALAAFSCWKFLERKYLMAGLALGVGSLFQPLVGLQLGLLLVGTRFLLHAKGWKQMLRFILPFGVFASLILVPVLFRQSGQEALESELYWDVLYRFRNYHHYLPSLFPIGHYIKAGSLAVLGVVSFAFLRPKNSEFYFVFTTLALLGIAVYAVTLEMEVFPQIGKTQWFKTTVWIGLLGSVGLSGLLTQLPKVSTIIKGLLPGSSVLGLLVIGCMTILMNSIFIPNSAGKYMIGNREISDIEKMHYWIEDNTDKDILILVPPNDNSFSCQAKRSVPIHFTAVIHEPEFMLYWYDRYSKIYGVTLENLVVNAKDDAVSLYQTRNYRDSEYDIDMRLDNLETCQFKDELGPVIHQEGSWVLTEFLPEK